MKAQSKTKTKLDVKSKLKAEQSKNCPRAPSAEYDRELNPFNLLLFDDEKGVVQARLKFQSKILSVQLTQRRLYVRLAQELQIYNLRDLTLFDVVPIMENSACFDVFEADSAEHGLTLLAYASPTRQGRAGLNIYTGGTSSTQFIDASVSPLSVLRFTAQGRHVLCGSENGKVVKRFSNFSAQLSGLYKRSSEAARITSIDCADDCYLVCSEKGTAHVFRVEAEQPFDVDEFLAHAAQQGGSRVRETRAHATYKAAPPGVQHTAALAREHGIIVVLTERNEYAKAEFQPTGGEARTLSRWELQ